MADRFGEIGLIPLIDKKPAFGMRRVEDSLQLCKSVVKVVASPKLRFDLGVTHVPLRCDFPI